jgi:hypothetical protein
MGSYPDNVSIIAGVPNLGDAGRCPGGRQCLKKWIEIAIFAIKKAI